MGILNLFKAKCPKCDGNNISVVKLSFWEKMKHNNRQFLSLLFFWPALFFMRKSKPLMVCKDCGFSWEKR